MRIYCVPSHHWLDDPMLHQGVAATEEMLQAGIWCPQGATMTSSSETTFRRDYGLKLSGDSAEYIAALHALLRLHDGPRFSASVSLRWCSHSLRLVTTKRVWLSIYEGNRRILSYSHRDRQPLYTFLTFWQDTETHVAEWFNRFSNAVGQAIKANAA